MKGSRFSCAPLKICRQKMNCLLCSQVQERRIPSDPEGKEVHSGVIHTRGACVVLLLGPKPVPGKTAGQSDSPRAGAQRGAPSPTSHTPAGCPGHPPLTQSQQSAGCALIPQQWPLRSLSHWCCRARARAWQPAAGRPASLEPTWATPMTQFLCTAPTVGGGGQRGRQRNGIQPGQVARFSLPFVTAQQQGGWASSLAPEARIYCMNKYLSSYVFILRNCPEDAVAYTLCSQKNAAPHLSTGV